MKNPFGVISLVVLAFGAGACGELTTEQQNRPLEPIEAHAPIMLPAAEIAAPVATVCTTFRRELAALHAQMTERGESAPLTAQLTTFENLVADACN